MNDAQHGGAGAFARVPSAAERNLEESNRSEGFGLRFYLGTHRPGWLELTDVPLCVSRRTLVDRKRLPTARGPWMLDSGGFTELALHGHWTIDDREYARQVDEIILTVGNCRAVAPQDWMCEPSMIAKTGGSVPVHQRLTIENFLQLRERLGPIVFPVLQGWTTQDYVYCWHMYEEEYGVVLEDEPLVGLGSVCRRGSDAQIAEIVRELQPLHLHAFGVRGTALKALAPLLTSADSMAWSYRGRRMARLPGCTHRGKSEANCLRWALEWRQHRLWDINQGRIECVA